MSCLRTPIKLITKRKEELNMKKYQITFTYTMEVEATNFDEAMITAEVHLNRSIDKCGFRWFNKSIQEKKE